MVYQFDHDVFSLCLGDTGDTEVTDGVEAAVGTAPGIEEKKKKKKDKVQLGL